MTSPTRVLYLGGTGEISYACVCAGLAQGHQVTVFNRGSRQAQSPLPDSVEQITGDLSDAAALRQVADRGFDVVCQFMCFDVERAQRDIDLFIGKTGQYVFISSASAYRKPPLSHVITESTPLANPFWDYSQKKADIEALLWAAAEERDFPVTIVRPSHTYRTRFAGPYISGDHLTWRLLQGKPIVVHGDGQSLWVVTHAQDFAAAFVHVLGNPAALGQAYHITHDQAHTWDHIVQGIARVMGTQARIVHVASDTLCRYEPAWTGPLLGDKTASVQFDNRKIKSLAQGWSCQLDLEAGLSLAAEHVRLRMPDFQPDATTDALLDRIINDVSRLPL